MVWTAEQAQQLRQARERIINEPPWSEEEKAEMRWLNKPPDWYVKIIDIAHLTNGAAEDFRKQAETSIELAKKCELHPFLHSFIDLNKAREDIMSALGVSDVLYDKGTAEKFMVDSAFDEVIDEIVRNLGRCNFGK